MKILSYIQRKFVLEDINSQLNVIYKYFIKKKKSGKKYNQNLEKDMRPKNKSVFPC